MVSRIEVAMFAHGEGRLVERAVDSVRADLGDVDLARIVILANGPTEETWEVTQRLVRDDPRVEALWIERGDKCNAWNAYVHDLAGDADAHFFMDSDCWVVQDSLARMAGRIGDCPEANAVAGLPFGGWRGDRLRRLVTEYRWLFGGLYGLSHRHLEAIRAHQVRLPVGLCGNDHFITQIAWSDRDFEGTDPERVLWCERAGFGFERLAPWRPRDLRRYWSQQLRYRHREFQIVRLRGTGPRDLPQTMDVINREILGFLRGSPPPEFLRALPNLRTRYSIYDRALRRRLEALYADPSHRPLEQVRCSRSNVLAGDR